MSRARNLRRRHPAGVLIDEFVPDEASLHVQAGRQLEAVLHEPPAPEAPQLSAWQRTKLRQAMQQALLRRRWVLVPR